MRRAVAIVVSHHPVRSTLLATSDCKNGNDDDDETASDDANDDAADSAGTEGSAIGGG
jgi:hypothetical protein